MRMKKWRGWLAFGLLTGIAPVALAEYGLNFPEPATPIAREIFDLHMLTTKIVTVLMIIAMAIIFYSVYTHRKSRGYQPDLHFHKGWFGTWSWVLVPVMVLGIDLTIAGSAQSALERMWDAPKKRCTADSPPEEKCYDMIVKVIGHQWWWEFQYPDEGIIVESRFVPKEKAGDLYLREVDNPLVLPVGKKIRFLHTSADVNHAFWVPELGMKKDAIAGYITETWAQLDREGTFRGQCAELCGTWHARMPIVVASVSEDEFREWVAMKQEEKARAAAEASADKVWSRDELMAKGKTVYETKCAACHQVTGLGLPPAFPPLKGSKIATGPLGDHIRLVLDGKGNMPAWASLNDLELAAVITYERNAWGNDTGDVVQPADIRAAR
ncbi:MAG TPA: cytochrome c oxidase subunit II [Thiotrichales bacterium]|nr:cytochrome c oxidase subunit II [Thiotrichales bacterium]